MVRQKLAEIFDVHLQHLDVVRRLARIVVLRHVDLDDRAIGAADVHDVARQRGHLELRLYDRDRLRRRRMGGLRRALRWRRRRMVASTAAVRGVNLHVAQIL